MKKLFKISAYSFGSLFGLVLLMLLFTQTGWFKDILRNEIQDIANENLNGTLKIGSIKGSLFRDIEINEVSINQDEQQILFIKQAALNYSLWGLISNSVGIEFIKIDSLFLQLTQVNDSTWNLNQLIQDDAGAVEENDTSSFTWEIDLDLFQIKNSNLNIYAFDTASVIPKQINNLNMKTSASVKQGIKKLSIDNLSFSALEPDININEIIFTASLHENKFELSKLSIVTAKNNISASGQYYTDGLGKSELTLETEPLHFSEFKEFLPQLGIQLNPVLVLTGEYQNSEGSINVSLTDSLQKINLTGNFSDLQKEPKYKTELHLSNINVSDWIKDTSAHSNINGDIYAEGKGIELENLNLSSKVKIENSELMKRRLDSLILSTDIFNGNIKSKIKIVSDFGFVDGKFDIEDIVGDQQIDFDAKVVNLNTSPVLLDDSIPSNLNLTIAGNLNGIKPESMQGSLSISAGNSSFMQYPIDTLNSAISMRSGDYKINKFEFVSPAADLNISGMLSQLKASDLSFSVEVKDLSTIPQLKDYQSISANGKIKGNLKGKKDSLTLNTNYNLTKLKFEDNSIESLNGELRANLNEKGISTEINSSIEQINSVATSVEKITFNAQYDENRISSTVNVTLNDTADLLVVSKVNLDSSITITISRLELNIFDQAWKNKNDSLKIIIEGNKYSVSNFELLNGEQKIMIDGNVDPTESDLDIDIAKLKTGELLNIFIKDLNVTATMDTKLKLEGSLDSPRSEGNIKISDLKYDEKDLGDLRVDFNLADDKFNWDFSLKNSESNILSSGYLPIIINADSNESIILGDEPLSFDLKIDSLTLTKLSEFNNNIEEVQGVISSDIKFSNSLNNLVADGYFKISDGSLKSNLLGVRYEDLNLNFEVEKGKFYLREFVIKNDDGSINIDGFVSYKSSLLNGEFDEVEIQLTANEFTAAETDNYEAKIDGKINFTNKSGEAKFDGEIELMRARVFLPYFTDTASEKQFDESEPILIRELGKQDSNLVSTDSGKTDSLNPNDNEYKFIKNINGQFTLVIPKNTWIVSPKLNIELSGEVDVVKTGSRLELFGNVDVLRGKVEVYGKEFDVIEGKIYFSGGEKINPELAMTLEYMFRGADRSKQYLQVIVEGTPEYPKLTFLLDDTQIDEGNAISYLLFGKSLDQLTQSQRTNVNNSNADLAKTIAGNFLATQLSSTLGSALGLDVIEIEGNNSWNSATLTAGKYLTDDLYVSYERGFGSTETNETNPRIVTLEYGLTKFLYFQLVEGNDKNSGFDFILKFDW